jgi:hypothetical protein
MTNLMQQLQAWADEGRYDFGNQRFATVLDDVAESSFTQLHKFETSPLLSPIVELVLNGILPVWLPVKWYTPVRGKEIHTVINGKVKQGIVDENGLLDGIVFSYWRPLPQPPQEVSHE